MCKPSWPNPTPHQCFAFSCVLHQAGVLRKPDYLVCRMGSLRDIGAGLKEKAMPSTDLEERIKSRRRNPEVRSKHVRNGNLHLLSIIGAPSPRPSIQNNCVDSFVNCCMKLGAVLHAVRLGHEELERSLLELIPIPVTHVFVHTKSEDCGVQLRNFWCTLMLFPFN